MMIFAKKRFVRIAGAGAVVLALALTGCTASGKTAAPDTGATMDVYGGASGQFVENYNPFSPTVLSNVNGMIYEPLFFFNALAKLGTKPVPVLGDSYSFNSDGTVLTVKIQKGVKWSDGKPFTASDVAYTFNALRANPSLNTTGNAPAAKVVNTNEVALTFDHPSFTDGPTFLGSTFIVPEHIWKTKKDITTDINKNPIGTGPMVASSFTAQSYLLKKSKTFRDASKVQVGGLRLYSLSGNQAATNKLVAGQLDWAGIFVPNIDKALKAAPTVSYSASGVQSVVLNTCSNTALGCTGPQTDPIVRQAISAAIDRNQVNKLAYYGKGTKISPTYALPGRDDQFISSDYPAASMSANISKAEKLLQGDGWAKGSDGIYAKKGQRLSMQVLVTSGYTDYIAALSVMTQQLKAAGIEIKTRQVANPELLSDTGLGKFQVVIGGIFQGPVADPYYIYNNSFSGKTATPVGQSGNPYGNTSRFSNKTVDAAIQAAGGTQNLAEKATQYKKIESIIVPSLPYIPIINNPGFGEFNTASFTGWPTLQNQYASAGIGGASGEQVVLNLKAK